MGKTKITVTYSRIFHAYVPSQRIVKTKKCEHLGQYFVKGNCSLTTEGKKENARRGHHVMVMKPSYKKFKRENHGKWAPVM